MKSARCKMNAALLFSKYFCVKIWCSPVAMLSTLPSNALRKKGIILVKMLFCKKYNHQHVDAVCITEPVGVKEGFDCSYIN